MTSNIPSSFLRDNEVELLQRSYPTTNSRLFTFNAPTAAQPTTSSLQSLPESSIPPVVTQLLTPAATVHPDQVSRTAKTLHTWSRRSVTFLWICTVNLLPVAWEFQALRPPLQTLLAAQYSWYTLSARYNNYVVQVPNTMKPQILKYPPEPSILYRPQASFLRSEPSHAQQQQQEDKSVSALKFSLVDSPSERGNSVQCSPLYRLMIARGEHPSMTTTWPLDSATDSFPSVAMTRGLLGCLLLRWVLPCGRFVASFVRKRRPEPWALVWVQIFAYITMCALTLPLLAAELPTGRGCISWWGWGWKGDDTFRVQRFFWLSNVVGIISLSAAILLRKIFHCRCQMWHREITSGSAVLASTEVLSAEGPAAAAATAARDLSIDEDDAVFMSHDRQLLLHLREAQDDTQSDRTVLWTRLEEASVLEIFCTPLWHPLAPLATLYFAFFGFTAGLLVLGVGFPRPCVKAVWAFCCLTILDCVLIRIADELRQWRRELSDAGVSVGSPEVSVSALASVKFDKPPSFLLSKDTESSDVFTKTEQLKTSRKSFTNEKKSVEPPLDEALNCVVCLDAPAQIVAHPCGHRELCKGCCAALIHRALVDFDRRAAEWLRSRRSALRGPRISRAVQCPLCRGAVRTFLIVVRERNAMEAEAAPAWSVDDLVASVAGVNGGTPKTAKKVLFGWLRGS